MLNKVVLLFNLPAGIDLFFLYKNVNQISSRWISSIFFVFAPRHHTLGTHFFCDFFFGHILKLIYTYIDQIWLVHFFLVFSGFIFFFIFEHSKGWNDTNHFQFSSLFLVIFYFLREYIIFKNELTIFLRRKNISDFFYLY